MPFTTDDLAERRAKTMAAEAPSPGAENQGEPVGPIRFTLRELLIAVTVIGVLLGLLRALGIFGAVLAFLMTALFTWVLYPKWRPNNVGSQQAMFDFLWGVGMPLVCLVFDPFVFKEGEDFIMAPPLAREAIYDHGFIVYAFVGCQMLVLTLLLILGNKVGRWSPLLGGFLVSGLMFAALVGLLLFIPAVIGTFFLGVGLLGLTPLITAYAYGRRALSCHLRSPHEAEITPLAVLGFLISVVGPLLLGLALLAALRGFDAIGNLLGIAP